MSSIELAKIPVNIVKALEEAGVDPASDGQGKDISSLDIVNTNYKLWDENKLGVMSEKMPGRVNKLKYALSLLFIYLYDNGKKSAAIALQQEINATAPVLGKSFKNEFVQLRAIHGRQVLSEKGILLSVLPDIPSENLRSNDLNFEKHGKDIKLTYYNYKAQSYVEKIIDTSSLKEIRFEGQYVKYGYSYWIKMLYEDSRKDYTITQ